MWRVSGATSPSESETREDEAQPEDIEGFHERIRAYAASLPGAKEDHPWGEIAVAIEQGVFLFLGPIREDAPTFSFSVRLPRSGHSLLQSGEARPTGYGFAGTGWVTVTIHQSKMPAVRHVLSWVQESFEAVREGART